MSPSKWGISKVETSYHVRRFGPCIRRGIGVSHHVTRMRPFIEWSRYSSQVSVCQECPAFGVDSSAMATCPPPKGGLCSRGQTNRG